MSDPAQVQDELIGKNVGSYRVESQISVCRWGKVYRAIQESMNRTVALRILSPELAALTGKVDHFLEVSRSEARIIHPHVVGVYEAGRADGYYFCAMEYMDGPALPAFLRKNGDVDEHNLLQTIIGVSRAMDFLWRREILHQPPMERNLLASSTGEVKLINIEPAETQPSEAPQEDILALGLVLGRLVNEIGQVSRPVGELVEQMIGAEGRIPFTSLGELAETASALDLTLFTPEVPTKQSEKEVRSRSTRALVLAAVGMFAVLIVVVAAIKLRHGRSALPPPRPDDYGSMVEVPAGEFVYQEGSRIALPSYYIDRYEVTIGQYKQFLDAIARGEPVNPHPFTPRRKDFKPANWELMLEAIEQRKSFNDSMLTWDSPVFGVDWFDAYAYAAWRGKRLPKEEEWEKAARGSAGSLYPWGNQFDATKCNVAAPGKTPQLAEVYAYPQDKSAFGIVGMAGGVSEWTGTTPNRDTAVVRGGAWKDSEVTLLRRITDQSQLIRTDTIGFRCAADSDVKPQ